MQLCGSLNILWHCLSLGLEWKLTFSSPVTTAEFSQFAGNIECSTFTASSFRIWNSSTGIPSPPLALFVVMVSKAHLTSHSRMSGSRWVITPSWKAFKYQFSFVIFSNTLLKATACFLRCTWYFVSGTSGKESTCNVGDMGSIPGLGRSPGEGKGYLP